MNYQAETKPGQDEPTSEPEHLEINSKAGQEDTGPEPDQEAAATEPGQEDTSPETDQEAAATEPGQKKTSPEPEYEKIKPPIDLNEIFEFEGGYRNPPRDRRFRKGKSGNPGGRPPGSKNKPKPLNDENFNEIVRSELYKNVKINGGPTVSIATAIMQKLGDLAIGGDMRAMKLALTTLQAADAAVAAQQEAEYNYWVAYVDRLKNDTMRMFYGSRRPVPDPKDIIFDHINKRVLQTGPRNEEEMLEKFAGKDFQEETTDEEEEESENVEVADECPEEMRCPPRSYSWDPDEPEEPRLRTPAPDEHEEERLRTPTPDERKDERLRTSTPDEPEDEREDERLRKPAPDEPEEPRLRRTAPEVEDERLRKPAA